MVTVVKPQDPESHKLAQTHELQDWLNGGALGAECQGMTIAGADASITMDFDASPDDAALEARLASFIPSANDGGESITLHKEWTLVEPAPASDTDFDILTIKVEDGSAVAVTLGVHLRAGPAVGAEPMTFTARRNVGEDVDVPRIPKLTQSEGGIKFSVQGVGDSVVVRGRRRGTDAVLVYYIGTMEPQP